ncbi:hypothetical protein ACPA9J_32760 [Pseudomonas aeruginosa]
MPRRLRDKRLVELNINAMVAGAKYRGEFEERLQAGAERSEASTGGEMILFIDEVPPSSVPARTAAKAGWTLANVLKPAMARGETQPDRRHDPERVPKYIEKDAALERRFQPVIGARADGGPDHHHPPWPARQRFEGTPQGEHLRRTRSSPAAKLSDRYISDRASCRTRPSTCSTRPPPA